jgi:hypothetical protein
LEEPAGGIGGWSPCDPEEDVFGTDVTMPEAYRLLQRGRQYLLGACGERQAAFPSAAGWHDIARHVHLEGDADSFQCGMVKGGQPHPEVID